MFAVDAVNFCFWPDNSGCFEYEDMTKAFAKILKATPDFFTPSGLALTTSDFLKENVFTTPNEFALLDERARLLREVG